MADSAPERPHFVPESVALLADAAGITIDSERLPDVTAVLAELFALDAVLDDLDLTGIDPDIDDDHWPERGP
jgi:hypothetical protein